MCEIPITFSGFYSNIHCQLSFTSAVFITLHEVGLERAIRYFMTRDLRVHFYANAQSCPKLRMRLAVISRCKLESFEGLQTTWQGIDMKGLQKSHKGSSF